MKKIFSLLAVAYLFQVDSFAQVIDVHSHIIRNEYTDFLRAHNAELQETFPLPKWDIKAHLDFMENMGIDYSVLSLPAPQPYFGNSKESADMVRKLNELSAKVRDENPDKFKFLATLPLPDVKAAIKEAQYAFDVLHADGVKLATNSYGQYLGDEELDELMPVFAKIIKIPEETIYVFINEYDAENVGVGHKLLCDLHKDK